MEDKVRILNYCLEKVVNRILREDRNYLGKEVTLINAFPVSQEILRVMERPFDYDYGIVGFTFQANLVKRDKKESFTFSFFIDPAYLSHIFSSRTDYTDALYFYLGKITYFTGPRLQRDMIYGIDEVVIKRVSHFKNRLYEPLEGFRHFISKGNRSRYLIDYDYLQSQVSRVQPRYDFDALFTPFGMMRIAAFLEQGSSGGVVRVCGKCFMFTHLNSVSGSSWSRTVAPPSTVYPVMVCEGETPTLIFPGKPGMMFRSTYESRLFKDTDTVDLYKLMHYVMERCYENTGFIRNDKLQYKAYVDFMKKVNRRYISLIVAKQFMKNKN